MSYSLLSHLKGIARLNYRKHLHYANLLSIFNYLSACCNFQTPPSEGNIHD